MSTMLSIESKCYIDTVLNIWVQVGIWKLMAIESFGAMLLCILADVYFGTFWLGIIFGIMALTFAVIGAEIGYFEINNFMKVYMYEKISEEEADFYKRCESLYIHKSNLVKYEHLLVG